MTIPSIPADQLLGIAGHILAQDGSPAAQARAVLDLAMRRHAEAVDLSCVSAAERIQPWSDERPQPVTTATEPDAKTLVDAMYLMALELLKHVPGCWACPASRSCECTDKHDCPKHLCRYWLGRAEDLCSGEVPSWR